MSETRTAFVTFFPIRPNNMGSSTVVNSRFINNPNLVVITLPLSYSLVCRYKKPFSPSTCNLTR